MRRWLATIGILLIASVGFYRLSRFVPKVRPQATARITPPHVGPVLQSYDGPCNLPLYHDPYSAFAIGRPAGWKISLTGGGVMVTKDPQETIGAMVFPMRLKGEYPASRLLDLFSGAIGDTIRKSHGTYRLSGQYLHRKGRMTIAGGIASATLQGKSFVAPIWVQKEPGFATLKFYFSPQASFENDEPVLKEVVGCFRRDVVVEASPSMESASLRPFRSQYYGAMIPANWQVTGETQNGLDLAASDRTASVSFGYMSSPYRTTPYDFAYLAISRSFANLSIIRKSPLPASAPGWQAGSLEFRGSYMGRPVRGVAIGVVYNGYTTAYDMVYIKVARADLWQAVRPLLDRIAGSIQISQGNVGSMISRQNASFNSLESHIEADENAESAGIMGSWEYRSRVQSVESQKFENALLGNEWVKSPSTGDIYNVSEDQYWSTGPDGGGFYRKLPGGGYEKLTPETEEH